jgi:serine/threonine-protein kinase
MLYCFVTGQLPFQGDSNIALVQAKEKGKFEPARQHNSEVSERLDLIIDKMLAKEPRHRYQSCAELILDLDGLDLANPHLSILEEAQGIPKSSAGSATRVSTPTRPVLKGKTKIGTRKPIPPPVPERAEEEEAPTEWWYIAYKTPQGKTVTRKMSEAEVMSLINEEHFDPLHTQASRTLKGGYRDLATYREFEQMIRKRMTRVRANRKAAKLRDAYQQIEEQQARDKRWRWFRNLVQRVGGGVAFMIWLGCVSAAAVGAYFLITLGIQWLGKKVDDLEKKDQEEQPKQQAPMQPPRMPQPGEPEQEGRLDFAPGFERFRPSLAALRSTVLSQETSFSCPDVSARFPPLAWARPAAPPVFG